MTGVTANPELFPDATFEGKDSFAHFENSQFPKCFFCNSQKMAVRPEVRREYLILPATMRLRSGQFKVIPGCHLILPTKHCEHVRDLPNYWTGCIQDALRFLEPTHLENIRTYELDPDEPPSYNLTMNIRKSAGQTAGHLHEWVIQRGLFDEGLGANLGLAGILVHLSEYGIVMPEG